MATLEKRTSNDGAITWRAKIRRVGAKPISKTFARKTDAQAWARDIERQHDRGYGIPSPESLKRTLTAAIERWVDDRLPEMAESDRSNVKQMLDWWKAELGVVALVRLDPETIETAAKRLRDEKDQDGKPVRTAARVNRYIATLSRALGYAERTLRWISSNPCRHVKRFKEPPGRTRYLTEDETAKLLELVDARAKPAFSLFVRIALGTGARRGEIAKVQWRDLDLIYNRITFRNTKTGDDRTVPLSAALVDIIKKYGKVRPMDPAARLFPHEFYFDWREIQSTLPDFRFHDTRHTVASHLAMNGASMLDIAAVTGHKTLAMVKRYSHLSDDHVRSKLDDVAGKLLKKSDKKA